METLLASLYFSAIFFNTDAAESRLSQQWLLPPSPLKERTFLSPFDLVRFVLM